MEQQKAAGSAASRSLDEATLRLVGQRVPEAMNAFFDHYFDRVYAYVVTLVRDPILGQDLAQEAFLRMHRAIHRMDPGRDPSGWVFTIVTNTVRDHWRSRQHRDAAREVEWTPENDTLAGGDDGPERSLEQKEAAEAVRRALDALSPADREVILLRNFEGLATGEIAAILGTSHDAVRQRHSRALARLGRAYRRAARGDRIDR